MVFANDIQTKDTINVDLLCWRLVSYRHSLHKNLYNGPWGMIWLKLRQCNCGIYHPDFQAEEHFGS